MKSPLLRLLVLLCTFYIAYHLTKLLIDDENNIKAQWVKRLNANQGNELEDHGMVMEFFILIRVLARPTADRLITPKPKVDFYRILQDDWLLINTTIIIFSSLMMFVVFITALCPFNDGPLTILQGLTVPAPAQFNNTKDKVKDWITRLEDFFMASKITDNDTKRAYLINGLDSKTSSLITAHSDLQTKRTANQSLKYKDLKDSFFTLFSKSKADMNELLDRLMNRYQEESENLGAFYTNLNVLAKRAMPSASYQEISEVVGNRFVNGLRNKALQIELNKYLNIKMTNLFGRENKVKKFNELLAYATSIEHCFKTNKTEHRQNRRSASINNERVFSSHLGDDQQWPDYYSSNDSNEPTNNYSCNLCKMYGHKRSACPLKTKIQINNQSLRSNGLIDTCLNTSNQINKLISGNEDILKNKRAIYGLCRINNHVVHFLADTGCTRTIINSRLLNQDEKNKVKKVNFYALTCNELPIQILGILNVKIVHNRYVTHADVLVTNDLEEDCLMGLDFMSKAPQVKKAIEELRTAIQAPMKQSGAYEYFSSNDVSEPMKQMREDDNICRLQIITKQEYNELQNKKGRPRHRQNKQQTF